MLFVVRFTGEPDVRWRAINARNAVEARIQALCVANGEYVEYGSVDPETGSIEILETVGGIERPTGT
jgi:hypothetical protein